jgi:hypothetical protein
MTDVTVRPGRPGGPDAVRRPTATKSTRGARRTKIQLPLRQATSTRLQCRIVSPTLPRWRPRDRSSGRTTATTIQCVNSKRLEFVIPPGKLPLMHAICKAGIVLDGKVQLGDWLMAADDLTVTDWTVPCTVLSKLICDRSIDQRRTDAGILATVSQTHRSVDTTERQRRVSNWIVPPLHDDAAWLPRAG